MDHNNYKRAARHLPVANDSTGAGMIEGLGDGSSTITQLVSSSYGDQLIGSLRSLQLSDELCDFTIRCGHKYIRVHKVLLAATSGFFCAMLRVPMKEMKEDTVELHSLKPTAIQSIIDFIYSARISLSLDTLTDIVQAANHLQVQSALDVCSDYIISKLNFSNADFLVHNIADTHSLTRVLDFYHSKVLSEFELFTTTPIYLDVSIDQLLIYISSSSLAIQSELRLLDMIDTWIGHDPASRAQHCAQLIACVRFGLMSKQQLTEAARHVVKQTAARAGPAVSTAAAEALIAGVQAGYRYHSEAVAGHPALLPAPVTSSLGGNVSVCKQYASLRSTTSSLILIHTGSSSRQFDVTAYDGSSYYRLAVDQTTCRDSRSVVVDNFLFVLRVVDAGGGTLVTSLLRFDPRHLNITVLPSCRRLRLDPAVAAVRNTQIASGDGLGGKVYVFGGCVDVPDAQSGHMVLDSVEVYDVSTNRWDTAPSLPSPTHSHAACALPDGRVLISGGVTFPSGLVSSAVYMFNPASGQYVECAELTSARRLHEMLWVKDSAGRGSVYAVGGINAQHTFHNSQTLVPVEKFDPISGQWTVLKCAGGQGGFGGTLAGRSVGHFVVFGGDILSLGREHHLATEEDIWKYNEGEGKWEAWGKVPARWSLATTTGVTLKINFSDEKVLTRAIDKR